MLGALRKAVSSWLGLAILGLALVAMVVTLFYGQTPGPAGGARGSVVVAVGPEAVTEPEWIRAVNLALEVQRRDTPQMTLPDFVRLGGADVVLEQLVLSRTLDLFGREARLPIGRRLVDGEIASLPAAQVGGRFDEAAFRRFLGQAGVSEEELRRELAGELARRLTLVPVTAGLDVPDRLARAYARLLFDRRRGVVLAVPFAAVPEPAPPDEATLVAFWKAEPGPWTVPERRRFRVAAVETERLWAEAEPTAAEVEAYWKEHPEEFGGMPFRRLAQVVLPDEARARDFVRKVRAGEDFARVAAAAGFAPADTDLGRLSERRLAAMTNEAVARAAFSAAPGAVTDPVRGAFGWHVVKVLAVEPPRPVPLAEARADIAARLRQRKREELLARRVDDIEDRLEQGEPLGDVARALGLAVETVGPLTADGRRLTADDRLEPAGHPLLARAFALDPEEGPAVVQDGAGRFYVLEVAEVIPPAPIPLERIRDRVVQAWRERTRTEAARRVAERVAAALDRGEDPVALARTRRLPSPEKLDIRRVDLSRLLGAGQAVPAALSALLDLPVGRARVVADPGRPAWFVVRPEAHEPGDADAAEALLPQVREALGRTAADELAETFARALERAVGVVRQPGAIAAVKARLAGEGEAP